MKKITNIILLAIVALFLLFMNDSEVHAYINVYEEQAVQTDPGTNGLWHVIDGDKAYVHKRMSIHDYSDFPYVGGAYQTSGNISAEFIETDASSHYFSYKYFDYRTLTQGLYPVKIENPDPSKYLTFKVIMKVNNEELLILESDNVGYFTFDFSNESFGRYRISSFNTLILFNSSNQFIKMFNEYHNYYNTSGSNNPTIQIKAYWEKYTEVDPGEPSPEDPIPWLSALPNNTSGNPENPTGQWGEVANFNYNSTTKRLSANVLYNGQNISIPNIEIETSEDDYLKRTKRAFYFTQNSNKFLYLNFSNAPGSFMLKDTLEEIEYWNGHALWNLTTGQVHVLDQVRVFNYIKITPDNEVMSYFYMPDTPVDSLLSVTSNVAHRYWNPTWFGLGPKEPGPIYNQIVTSSKGEFNSIRPSWVKPVYQGSYMVGITGSAIALNAVIVGTQPWIGLGIAAFGLVSGGIIQAGYENNWFNYDIEQVQKLVGNETIRNEMAADYYAAYNEVMPSISGKGLFRVSYGQFTGSGELQIMKELSRFVQVVFETDGITYTISEENIDDTWTGPGTEEPENIDGIIPEWALYLISIVTGLFILFNLGKIFDSLKKRPFITIVLLIVIFYVLIQYGLI